MVTDEETIRRLRAEKDRKHWSDWERPNLQRGIPNDALRLNVPCKDKHALPDIATVLEQFALSLRHIAADSSIDAYGAYALMQNQVYSANRAMRAKLTSNIVAHHFKKEG